MNFRNYLLKIQEELNEVQRTGSQDRDEFSGEKYWNQFKDKSKILFSDDYILYKYKDFLFLTKDNNYIAYIDGITDKLNSKKSLYINVSHSKERGAMAILLSYLKKSGYKQTVSDTMLSDDAIKYYEKLIKKYNYFAINYKDEIVNISDHELFNNPDYRIVIIL